MYTIAINSIFSILLAFREGFFYVCFFFFHFFPFIFFPIRVASIVLSLPLVVYSSLPLVLVSFRRRNFIPIKLFFHYVIVLVGYWFRCCEYPSPQPSRKMGAKSSSIQRRHSDYGQRTASTRSQVNSSHSPCFFSFSMSCTAASFERWISGRSFYASCTRRVGAASTNRHRGWTVAAQACSKVFGRTRTMATCSVSVCSPSISTWRTRKVATGIWRDRSNGLELDEIVVTNAFGYRSIRVPALNRYTSWTECLNTE